MNYRERDRKSGRDYVNDLAEGLGDRTAFGMLYESMVLEAAIAGRLYEAQRRARWGEQRPEHRVA